MLTCTALLASVVAFFFNDTATTEIYTLSLHDALPIFHPFLKPHDEVGARTRAAWRVVAHSSERPRRPHRADHARRADARDRKSTRLNSSHANISYAVFCLKKKIKTKSHTSELQSLQ